MHKDVWFHLLCYDLEAGLRRRSTNCAKLSTIRSGVTVACFSSSGLHILLKTKATSAEISCHVRLQQCVNYIMVRVIFSF